MECYFLTFKAEMEPELTRTGLCLLSCSDGLGTEPLITHVNYPDGQITEVYYQHQTFKRRLSCRHQWRQGLRHVYFNGKRQSLSLKLLTYRLGNSLSIHSHINCSWGPPRGSSTSSGSTQAKITVSFRWVQSSSSQESDPGTPGSMRLGSMLVGAWL